jgi:hypothetical protein
MDKLVYVATNPVKDRLVDRVHHWPGPNFFGALMAGRTMRATRPDHFFSEDGPMPESVELVLTLPPQLGDRDTFLAELGRRVQAVEEEADAITRGGGGYVGRSQILSQSWLDSPTSDEPRRDRRPRVACRSKWARIQTLQRNQLFIAEYRVARAALLAGTPIPFPAGTYWLRRFANVPVAPLPT